jgi:hypothetical protein
MSRAAVSVNPDSGTKSAIGVGSGELLGGLDFLKHKNYSVPFPARIQM